MTTALRHRMTVEGTAAGKAVSFWCTVTLHPALSLQGRDQAVERSSQHYLYKIMPILLIRLEKHNPCHLRMIPDGDHT